MLFVKRQQNWKRVNENVPMPKRCRPIFHDTSTLSLLLPKNVEKGWKPICYHGPHKLWIIAGGPQWTTDCILTFYLYLTMRDGGFLLHPTFSTCLSWSFILTWLCTLNCVKKILMRAISNVNAGRRFPTPDVEYANRAGFDKPNVSVFLPLTYQKLANHLRWRDKPTAMFPAL